MASLTKLINFSHLHQGYDTFEDGLIYPHKPGAGKWLSPLVARLMAFLVLSTAIALFLIYGVSSSPSNILAQFEIRKSWAQYSPFFPVEQYRQPPGRCKVVQVNILQRHGARYPTASAAVNIRLAVSKLKSAKTYTEPQFKFLTTYNYDLGEDDLVPFGAREARDAGIAHHNRYSSIIKPDSLPFVRASSSERVVLSAQNWTEGFSIASHHIYNPRLSVILSESLNDTLNDSMCPNAGSSDIQTSEWLARYGPPVAARLNKGAPGANLTSIDAFALLSLCPFDSVAKNTLSPFCALFSDSEFEQFEYSGDLDKYYNTGYGQPLGPVQGVGYINELIARLTGKPVQDNTQTNRTLTSSPVTFPLNRTMYADFSHDNQMIAIYAALGLFPQSTSLEPSHPNPNRNWLASRLVPFSAQMITEKLICDQKEFVRIFVNNARQPLKFCGAQDNGMCELGAFVDSQAYARNNGSGDFEKCFE